MTFTPPDYARSRLLSDVVPMAATALSAADALDPLARERTLSIAPDASLRVAVVALIDGLGARLLRARAAHAPFLRSLLPDAQELSAGFPSTTANSLSSLGTGLLPGAHGVVGYRLRDPGTGEIFSQLAWDSDTDPQQWVPDSTLFERLTSESIDVVGLGEPKFAGRGLNRASLRGGRFRGSGSLDERVAQAAAEVRAPGRRLVYFYWGNLDKMGHVHGVDSWEWLSELEAVDAALHSLAQSLKPDTGLFITADHGMVDVPHESRLDLAEHPELRSGLVGVGGEPRAIHLYTQPGAQNDVAAAFTAATQGRAHVLTRAEAIGQGWFGPVRPAVTDRIGDVIVVAGDSFGIVDSLNDSPSSLALVGHHGGVTESELAVPLFTVLG